MTVRWIVRSSLLSLVIAGCSTAPEAGCRVRDVVYNGWECIELTNGFVDVVVAPQLGGRIVQIRLDDFEYLWIDRDLAGATPHLPLDGKWANYGGDKLWPAPQGWSGPNEWPGPPDPADRGGRTDSCPFDAYVLAAGPDEAALRLVGPHDFYAGVRFVREIWLRPKTTTIELSSTIENMSDRQVRWGIWEVTQHDARPGGAATPGAPLESDVVASAPINPQSRHPNGYRVMFGSESNPQFAVTEQAPGKKVFRLDYAHAVGKAALDSFGGWLAVSHQRGKHLFVHTFTPRPELDYPDGATVEFWASGTGTATIAGKDQEFQESEPWLIESEVLSPFATLEPGYSYTFKSAIHLARAAGPVVDVDGALAALEPLTCDDAGNLSGAVAAFREGDLMLQCTRRDGDEVSEHQIVIAQVRPGDAMVLHGLLASGLPAVPAGYVPDCVTLYTIDDRIPSCLPQTRRDGALPVARRPTP